MTKLNIAGLVGSKVDMRDKILAEFYQPDKTKNILKGSGFVTDAFGPLPESLKLCLNSINGKEHMYKPKVTAPASSKNNNRRGYNSSPLSNQFFIPEWGPGLSMLHPKPLKIKRTLPKTPLRVDIMDQRGVKGFGVEEGAPGETMA